MLFLQMKNSRKGYVRYMDDMVLWHDDKAYLKKCMADIKVFLSNDLSLVLKHAQINKTYAGLNFLGYKLKKDYVKLSVNSKKRFVRKMKLYADNLNSGFWSQGDYQRHVVPLISYTDYASNIKPLRSLIIEKLKVNTLRERL